MSDNPFVTVRCPECDGVEEISEHSHFRLHDHACPLMPADMANIPNEIKEKHDD